jgi:hypothetical protein
MERRFDINTEPHRAVIGNVTLLFQPEAAGASFAQAYTELREVQQRVSAVEDSSPGVEELMAAHGAMRAFVARFVTQEARATFDSMELPDRVLVGLIEFLAEVYGGGSQKRPTGRASGSSPRSKTSGTTGSATSH